MSENEGIKMNTFRVYFYNDLGDMDYAILRAEDEDHARRRFAHYYSGVKIECVDDKGPVV